MIYTSHCFIGLIKTSDAGITECQPWDTAPECTCTECVKKGDGMRPVFIHVHCFIGLIKTSDAGSQNAAARVQTRTVDIVIIYWYHR